MFYLILKTIKAKNHMIIVKQKHTLYEIQLLTRMIHSYFATGLQITTNQSI